MFKLRSGGQGGQGGSGPAQTPSIESVRRQARQRLIGAAVLVLIGIIGLPWLFDTQPRPVPVDIVIDIPAKDAVPPLALPQPGTQAAAVPPVEPGTQAVPAPAQRAPAAAPAALPPGEPPAPAVPTSTTPAVAVAPPSGAVTTAKVPVTPQAPAAAPAAPVAPAAPAATDAARAQAILEGRPVPANVRVVVQVGAFAEQARAQEVRMRLERAGLKTYTHVAQTAQGPRIRVRLGPFDSRAEAEKAAEKVRQLGLPASILTL